MEVYGCQYLNIQTNSSARQRSELFMCLVVLVHVCMLVIRQLYWPVVYQV